MAPSILWFKDIGLKDINEVGGKNASLGEMINHLESCAIAVPNGFATTAHAFYDFLKHNQLDQLIEQELLKLNIDDIASLNRIGHSIRRAVLQAQLPEKLEADIREAWQQLSKEHTGKTHFAVAVRSSATAEDLPDASFAGQQETLLNVVGIDAVLAAVKTVFASLYNDRAIAYRAHHHFDQTAIALSAGIQHMVRSDLAASGVMFSLDTESGNRDVVLITGSYGLGETIVQGIVNPDEFCLYKPSLKACRPAILQKRLGSKQQKMIYAQDQNPPTEIVDVNLEDQQRFCLSDAEVTELANKAIVIENHYGRPMDIEWAKDGNTNQLYIVQARPETAHSQTDQYHYENYMLEERGELLIEGRSIGQRIGVGVARVIQDISEMDKVQVGDVLVTDMTDPEWEPVMQRAAAIVTNRGGRTCHAAIIAREFKVPAVVGCKEATSVIKDGQAVTVSCAEGDTGYVYEGRCEFSVKEITVDKIPSLPVKVMMNVGNPERAFAFAQLPNEGVGLARLEFIISNSIGIHPQALLNYPQLPTDLQAQIDALISNYSSPIDYYVEKLAEGVATIAAAFAHKPVIVRLSDFKSNEYRNLLGGHLFEPVEENPMLGFRGASRYINSSFADAFALECQALSKVRDDMGFTNVQVMIPFVRTVKQAAKVCQVLDQHGLKRGVNDLQLIMMCEIPSNAILAEQFLEYFDGFSIGSNDLTQLTLGVDRDSGLVADDFDECDPSVMALLEQAIQTCQRLNKYVGICGQGPSDHPDFAKWLVEQGIESISLVPDTVLKTILYLAEHHTKVKTTF